MTRWLAGAAALGCGLLVASGGSAVPLRRPLSPLVFAQATAAAAPADEAAPTPAETSGPAKRAKASKHAAKPPARQVQVPLPPAAPPPPASEPRPSVAPAPAPGPAEAPPFAAPVPSSPDNDVGELQPVLHAQNAKITTCMDTIVAASATVINGPHTAVSTWSASAPNSNVFESIVGLSYPSQPGPNGAAVILAAPTGPAKCEGGTVQIYPLAQPCSVIQAALIKQGRTIAMLRALPLVETKEGFRDVLMPTAGNGCVVVAIGLKQ